MRELHARRSVADRPADVSGADAADRRSSRPRLGGARRARAAAKDTLIVFTSDHGDFLGDHWLGEKEHFYDTVQRVPLIVYDPDSAADVNPRSAPRRAWSEGVDIAPTFLDALELPGAAERIEGRSLLPLTRAADLPAMARQRLLELDYGYREARRILGRSTRRMPGLDGSHRPLEICPLAGLHAAIVRTSTPTPEEYRDLGARCRLR